MDIHKLLRGKKNQDCAYILMIAFLFELGDGEEDIERLK
jgi:hypothetical protein